MKCKCGCKEFRIYYTQYKGIKISKENEKLILTPIFYSDGDIEITEHIICNDCKKRYKIKKEELKEKIKQQIKKENL